MSKKTDRELLEKLHERYETPFVNEITEAFTDIHPPQKPENIDHERLANLIGGDVRGHYHLNKNQVDKLDGYPLYEVVDNRIKKVRRNSINDFVGTEN